MLLALARYLLKIIVASIVLAVMFRFITVRFFHQGLVAGVWTFGCLDSLGLGALLAYVGFEPRLGAYIESFLRWSLVLCAVMVVVLTVCYLFNVVTSMHAGLIVFGLSLILMV